MAGERPEDQQEQWGARGRAAAGYTGRMGTVAPNSGNVSTSYNVAGTGAGGVRGLSEAQQAYLAGIRNYTGTEAQRAQLAQWQANEQALAEQQLAEQAQARWRDPNSMAPGQSTNFLGKSADGKYNVAYAADPGRLDDQAFQLGGFSRQLSDYNQLASQSARQLGSDMGNAAQSRGMLLSDLTSTGPSAAELQLQAGQDAAANQAMALARSGRGMSGAGAMRAALQQGAAGSAQANQQAGILRAQEAQQRTQQLAQLNQMDRASIGQSQAGTLSALGQRVGLTQAQQQAQADQAKTQMAADVGVNLQNAQFANYRDPPKDNSAAIAGAIASGLGAVATRISDIRAKTDIKPMSAPVAANGPNTFGAGIDYQGALSRGAGSLANIGGAVSSGMAYDAQANSQPVLIPPMLKPLELSDENSKEQIRSLTRQRDEWMAAAMGNSGEDIGRKIQRDNPATAEDMARMQRTGRAGPATQDIARDAASLATMTADDASLASLAQTPGYSYRYKEGEGEDPSRRHVGPMAQDLERTPVGESVIQTMPDGRKAIDTGRLSLVNSTATGELARRLANLENAYGMNEPQREPRNQARDFTLQRRPVRLSDLAGY